MNDYDSIIMIVDDDPFIVDYISRLFDSLGYRFITANNASTAFEIISENKVDIVLTDIKMPDVTGLGLLDKIYNFNPDIPVILMTGYAELNYAVEAIQKGAFDFIQKPFKPEILMNSIKRALRHCKAINIEKNTNQCLNKP